MLPATELDASHRAAYTSYPHTSQPDQLAFTLFISPPYVDGLDLQISPSSILCFDLTAPNGANIYAGGLRIPVNIPFNAATLGPCTAPQPTLSIVDTSATEGEGVARFNVNLQPPAEQPVTVDYTTIADSAKSGSDFQQRSGTLLFNPGDTSESIDITLVDDTSPETIESFSVGLSNPTNAALGKSTAVATITDDDNAVCGEPPINPATDRALFIWQECGSGRWNLRVTAAVGWAQYVGTLSSGTAGTGANMTNHALYSLEPADIFDYTSNPRRIDFSLSLSPPYLDGFSFSTSSTEMCLNLTRPAGASVLAGPGRTPVSLPFNQVPLGSCN